jgi:xylulokinase
VITLGIDVGTTHTKVLALDVSDGRTLALAAAPTPVVRAGVGEAHRPGAILELAIELVAQVTARLPDAALVRSLCVASVGEEVVLLDDAGTPVADAIAWYDPRGLEEAASFLAGPGGALPLSRRWRPDGTFSLFKLLWMREHAPQVLARARTWTDLGDWVLHGLGAPVVMDWSHASRAGAFDIIRRAWDAETVSAAELALEFPTLVPSRTVIGRLGEVVAARMGLPPDVALVSGGHDHLCAAYGAGLRSTQELFLSAGTSEAHLMLLESPLEGEAARGIDQGCYVDDHTWYAHVNIHSGHFFKGWRDLLYGEADDATMYDEVAAVPPGADGAIFDLTDDLRRGRLDAVPYDADRQTIMRAILEGLASRSSAIVDRLEAASGTRPERILVAGHPTRVELWKALRISAYGRPMAAVVEPESTAFGAAVMAAQAAELPGAIKLVARRLDWVR